MPRGVAINDLSARQLSDKGFLQVLRRLKETSSIQYLELEITEAGDAPGGRQHHAPERAVGS